MKKVCVITGGGSGMGLATAKLVCEEGYYTILVGRTASKLEKAVNDLHSAGGEAEAFSCDVSLSLIHISPSAQCRTAP